MVTEVNDDIFYVVPPDIPAGQTVDEYRREKAPVSKAWIAGTALSALLALRGIQFYKHNPTGE